MAVSSPRLVSMALGEKVDTEELGGWRLHAAGPRTLAPRDGAESLQ